MRVNSAPASEGRRESTTQRTHEHEGASTRPSRARPLSRWAPHCSDLGHPDERWPGRDRGNAPCPARGETRDRPRQRSTAQSEGDIGGFRATRARSPPSAPPKRASETRAPRLRAPPPRGRLGCDFWPAATRRVQPPAGNGAARAARVLSARARERARPIPAPPRGRSPFPAPRDRLTVAFPVSRVDFAISPTDRAWFFFFRGKTNRRGYQSVNGTPPTVFAIRRTDFIDFTGVV